MREALDNEFISAFIEVGRSQNPVNNGVGISNITPTAWKDLNAHFPERYAGLTLERDMKKEEVALPAAQDYFQILKNYMVSKRIPMTMDNLVGAYTWGVSNVEKVGIENAPEEVKNYIAKMRHILEPQAVELDANYNH